MDSMEEIYMKHGKMIYGFLLTRTRDPGLAEELTQETFYQAVKHIGGYKGESSISTWLCAIAKNLWRDYLRRHHIIRRDTRAMRRTPIMARLWQSSVHRLALKKWL